ncbi:MAG: M56 family metallopeptidase [Amnibacterium sp.]
MLLASALLGALAVALAWPVPLALVRARWPEAAPGLALVVWQSIALAGVLSLLGALLTAGLAPFGPHLLAAAAAFVREATAGRLPADASVPAVFGISAAVLLGAHLALNLAFTAGRVRRQRLRHLDLVLLLSTPVPDLPRTRLLDTPAPVAYCLPGTARSVTVLSAGLLELLSPEEVGAVAAHERAHVAQHHELVLVAFRAWRIALPWFPVANRAQDAVGLLIEMLADDQARRRVPDPVLARAIQAVATGGGTTGFPGDPDSRAPSADPESVARRVGRLTHPVEPPGPVVRRLVELGAIALVVVPAVLLALPAVLA